MIAVLIGDVAFGGVRLRAGAQLTQATEIVRGLWLVTTDDGRISYALEDQIRWEREEGDAP